MENLQIKTDGTLATLTINSVDKLNFITAKLLDELEAALNQLSADNTLKGLIIASAKPGSFIAGANVDNIAAITDEKIAYQLARRGQLVIDKISKLPFPSVAAINGTCLGGGLEMALACNFRVATDAPETSIGLPEILLGIIPGFGGTQRLPRLVGCSSALDLILTGKRLGAQQAKRVGLVDEVTLPEALLNVAKQLLLRGSKPSKAKKSWLIRMLDSNAVLRLLIAKQAHKKVAQTAKGYPAPPLAIEAIVHGMNLPIDAGLELEAGYCAKLIVGKVCKNLIHIFKLSESLKKNIKGGETTRVNKAGVLGGGTMGGGIAGLLAGQEITTRLFDVAAPALNHALKSFSDNLNRRVKQKQITKARAQQLLEKLHTTSTLNGFGNVDILIEAVVEKMEVKKQLFANLEGQLKDAAIIATNTSSLSVTEMATVLKQPQRLVGMHFFNPVHKMPLVEIIAGKQSDVKSLQSVYALALRLKKFPVIVKDSPGFLVNRLLGFYLNEAMFMLLEGAELESIDAALIDFGMPMGPFRLMDVVGLDIIEKAQSHLTAGLGLTAAGGQPRLPLSPLLQKVRDQNLLGEKNQQGFYLYQDGKPTSVNPLIPPMVNELKRSSQTPADDQLWKRPIFMMINEACRCLQEEIIGNPHHLDLAMVMGTGFPGFRGGLLRYAATLGVDAFHGELDEMSKRYGERFKPEANLKSVLQEIQRTTY